MLITIIIPVYNGEQFIDRCFQSIIRQTYHNLECVVVNDCSIDNTLNKLKEYEAKYPNLFRVFTNEKNGGSGVSRRKAIQEAKGEFIAFMDIDDWIDDNYIEIMVNKQKEVNADYISGCLRVEQEEKDRKNWFSDRRTLDYQEGIYRKQVHFPFCYMNIGKMVRKSLFDKAEYSGVRFNEDGISFFKIAYYANKLCYFNYHGYHYVLQDTSLCHTYDKTKLDFYNTLLVLEMYDFYKDKEEELKKRHTIFRVRNSLYYVMKYDIFLIDENNYIKYKEDMRRFIYLLEKNNELLLDKDKEKIKSIKIKYEI